MKVGASASWIKAGLSGNPENIVKYLALPSDGRGPGVRVSAEIIGRQWKNQSPLRCLLRDLFRQNPRAFFGSGFARRAGYRYPILAVGFAAEQTIIRCAQQLALVFCIMRKSRQSKGSG